MQYLVSLVSGKQRTVEGDPVVIRGFEKFGFFVHPTVEAEEKCEPWTLSEVESGFALTRADTRMLAISTGIYLLYMWSGGSTRKFAKLVKECQTEFQTEFQRGKSR